jgi:secreted PhoX family phosphatase
MMFGRRALLAGSAAAVAAGVFRHPLTELAAAVWPPARYGDLGPPDADGVRVPAGFTSTRIARTWDPVAGTDHLWHQAPDGGACFPTPDGGHVYVSNSEVSRGGGGVGAVWFDASGTIVDAATLLSGTSRNCAGGPTPWGTWLSCEESGSSGQVWEVDPSRRTATVRPAMGSFSHEAVAVDPVEHCCYLTEDDPSGRLYRFVPDAWPSLSSGSLQAARVVDGTVSWVDVRADRPERSRATTPFDGGEGIALDHRSLLFSTKGDRRVWELDLDTGRLTVFFDAARRPGVALTHVDNLVLHPQAGHLFVAEDGGDMELCMLTRTGGTPEVSAVVRFEGHGGSEVTGPAFSPDGRHLYVTSQRGPDGRGVTVRVTGPWATLIGSIHGAAEPRRGAMRIRT